MNVLDRFQKLAALAMDTNPANIEEQRSAAVQAIALLVEHNLTVGGEAATTYGKVNTKKTWRPDDEFNDFWEKTKNNDFDGEAGTGTGLKVAIQDTDIDDDPVRTRIKFAWRALQRERARLKTWIYEAEQRVGKRYPRPEIMDWEKE